MALGGLLRGITPFLPDDEELYLPVGGGLEPEVVPPPPPPPTFADEEPLRFTPREPTGVGAEALAPAPAKSTAGGLLKGAGRWLTSPNTLLAIGTTLRAGGGEDEAFADQARIINRWDTRRKEDEAAADLVARNKAMNEAFITDEKGKLRYDQAAHMAALKKYGVRSDQTAAIKGVKELRDTYQFSKDAYGRETARNPNDPTDSIEVRGADPLIKQITTKDGKTAFIMREAPEPGPVGGGPIPEAAAAPGAPAPVAPAAVPEAAPEAVQAAAPAAPAAPVADQIDLYGRAISGIETGGKAKPYQTVGPASRSGDRPYGKYQVMGANIPSWTEAATGKRMTPWEFLNSPEAQEAVFRHRFGGDAEKYGPQEAASRWFTGRSIAEGAKRRDVLGTSGSDYVRKFNANLARAGGGRQVAAAGAPGTPRPSGAPARVAVAEEEFVPPPGWKTLMGPTGGEPGVMDPKLIQQIMANGGIYRDAEGNIQQLDMRQMQGAKGATVPAAARNAWTSNASALKEIDSAIEAVKANPKAFGVQNILSQARLFNMPVGEAVYDQVWDENQKAARAQVSRIGAIRRHDVTGATATLSENPMLAPFLPNLQVDKGETVLTKLQKMREVVAGEQSVLDNQYGLSAQAVGAGGAGGGGGPPPSMLKEGVVTTFKGKGAWTLQGGVPVQVGD